MRSLLVATLKNKGVDRDFSFIERQNGMFSFSGLGKEQVLKMREDSAVYAVDSGRFSVAAMTTGNMDALTKGTLQGVELLINITAMLIVMVALVSLVNMMLGLLPGVSDAPLTLQRLLGWLLAPVAWLMGLPWEQAVSGGSLLGTKVILNELFAYLDLAALPVGQLDGRSQLIMTYALCGFANFGSLGIMIGGLATMVPERRAEIIQLGMKSIAAGTLATCMTGAVMGVLV